MSPLEAQINKSPWSIDEMASYLGMDSKTFETKLKQNSFSAQQRAIIMTKTTQKKTVITWPINDEFIDKLEKKATDTPSPSYIRPFERASAQELLELSYVYPKHKISEFLAKPSDIIEVSKTIDKDDTIRVKAFINTYQPPFFEDVPVAMKSLSPLKDHDGNILPTKTASRMLRLSDPAFEKLQNKFSIISVINKHNFQYIQSKTKDNTMPYERYHLVASYLQLPIEELSDDQLYKFTIPLSKFDLKAFTKLIPLESYRPMTRLSLNTIKKTDYSKSKAAITLHRLIEFLNEHHVSKEQFFKTLKLTKHETKMLNKIYEIVEKQHNTKLQNKNLIETPPIVNDFDNDVDDDGILTFNDLPKPKIKPDITPESILEEINEFESLEKSENVDNIQPNNNTNTVTDVINQEINHTTNYHLEQKDAEEMASHYASEAIRNHQALQIIPDKKGFDIRIFIPFE